MQTPKPQNHKTTRNNKPTLKTMWGKVGGNEPFPFPSLLATSHGTACKPISPFTPPRPRLSSPPTSKPFCFLFPFPLPPSTLLLAQCSAHAPRSAAAAAVLRLLLPLLARFAQVHRVFLCCKPASAVLGANLDPVQLPGIESEPGRKVCV